MAALPTPNTPHSISPSTPSKPHPEPSPAVQAHLPHRHLQSRYFLGPLPESVVNSNEVIEAQQWYSRLGRRISQLESEDDVRRRESEAGAWNDEEGRVTRLKRRLEARLKIDGDEFGEQIPMDGAEASGIVPSASGGTAGSGRSSWFSRDGASTTASGKLKKRKNVWVGGSFLIGQEFLETPDANARESADPGVAAELGEDGEIRPDQTNTDAVDDQAEGEGDGGVQRPSMKSRSTFANSYQTARTHQSFASSADPSRRSSGSTTRQHQPTSDDASSSTRHLITPAPTTNEFSSIPQPSKTIPKRLRSALKRDPKPSHTSPPLSPRPATHTGLPQVADAESPATRRRAGKTVQFPPERPPSPSPVNVSMQKLKLRLPKLGGSTTPSSASSISDAGKDPVPPSEVLARSGEEVAGTSAGIVEAKARDLRAERELMREEEEDHDDEESLRAGDVVMRDRMLVRVGLHRDVGIRWYDESAERRKPCARVDRFEEYLVVYRKGVLELYQDWKLPLKERYYKSKRLSYAIPLNTRNTTFSIFSQLDLSFSLCVDPSQYMDQLEGRHGTELAGRLRKRLQGTKQLDFLKRGERSTQVFVFLCKEKDRTVDWCWEIWRELGGELPAYLDVQVPNLSTQIRLTIPDGEFIGSDAACRELARKKVLNSCKSALEATPNYQDLMQDAKAQGRDVRLELAWLRDGMLDWLTEQQDKTTEGKSRYWAVVAGLSIMSPRSLNQLELRASHHLPSMIKLTDGKQLDQPAEVEGYLKRLDATGNKHNEVYIHTHRGNLFSSSPATVAPPLPPASQRLLPGSSTTILFDTFSSDENLRTAKNLLKTSGFVDLRDVEKITTGQRGDPGQHSKQIQVSFHSGEVVTFLAESREIAREWIRRLKDLSSYWSAQQRIDARQRMDSTPMRLGTASVSVDQGEPGSQEDALLPSIWNWCRIDSCSPIAHSGRLFSKHSPTKQFRGYFTVLAQGFLLQYRFGQTTVFHVQQHRYSLEEAYVYSGLLAQNETLAVYKEDAWTGEPRIYQDGLECADGAEDCSFVLWLRRSGRPIKKTKRLAGRLQQLKAQDEHYNPPPLGRSPKKMLILRARSKLERDVWVGAIRLEIQKHALRHPEMVLRERAAGLVPVRR